MKWLKMWLEDKEVKAVGSQQAFFFLFFIGKAKEKAKNYYKATVTKQIKERSNSTC